LPTVRKNDDPVPAEEPLRRRILDAAFSAFSRDGYAATSTLEIATGAQVSKRELYATVGNKQELLVACIQDRALRFAAPADLPMARDRRSLERILAAFGEQQLGELRHPNVIAMFRLAIAEAVRAPKIAQALDGIAREASRAGLRKILEDARAKALLTGEVNEMSDVFRSLLLGDLMIAWLLGGKLAPSARDLTQRAQRAAKVFTRAYSS
jgi:AcrR family transcriptional regulator